MGLSHWASKCQPANSYDKGPPTSEGSASQFPGCKISLLGAREKSHEPPLYMTLLWWRLFLFGNRTTFRPRKWRVWTWVHDRLLRHSAFSLLPGVLFCGKHWWNCWALPQAGASPYRNYDKWVKWLTYNSHPSHASSSAEATVGHCRCSRFWLKISWQHHANHGFTIFAWMQFALFWSAQ